MGLYLLKSGICLVGLWAFYKVLLEKSDMHVLKRFYLLGSLLMAFVIPLITFTYAAEATGPEMPRQIGESLPFNANAGSRPEVTPYFALAGWSVYLSGVILFGIKFSKNLFELLQKIRSNPRLKRNGIIKVLLEEPVVPHTFLRFIFLNRANYEARGIPEEVLIHEETHARQRHSIDVLYVELVQVLLWFNPLVYILKHAIKLNHEFLADQAVIKKGIPRVVYQRTLLAYATIAHQPALANAINYSSIKKRFTLMKTETSRKSKRVRSLLLLPLLALLLYAFSNKIAVYENIPAEQHLEQDKASPEMIAEYNALAKKYNSQSKNSFHVLGEEVERLRYIYGLMTEEQKAKAEPFPEFPDPPPAPDVIEMEKEVKTPEPQEPSKVEKAGKISKPYEPPRVDEVIEADVTVEVDSRMEHSADRREVFVREEKEAQKEVQNEVSVVKNVSVNTDWNTSPPPPPTPPSPALDLEKMKDNNALFYLNGKEVSAEEAIESVKNSDHLGININENNDERPVVHINTRKKKERKN